MADDLKTQLADDTEPTEPVEVRLLKLKGLADQSLITSEEYERKMAEILGEL